MSKGTQEFKNTIQAYLDKRAESDSLFAETLKKENKNIEECVNYILGEVQKSGCNGFDDSEIFGMAVHYYDEDDLKATKQNSANVIVNHKVQLTADDLAAAKEEAMKIAIEEAKIEAKKALSETIELSEEDIQAAKSQAIEKIAIDQKEKLVQKATKKKPTAEVEQIDLFA